MNSTATVTSADFDMFESGDHATNIISVSPDDLLAGCSGDGASYQLLQSADGQYQFMQVTSTHIVTCQLSFAEQQMTSANDNFLLQSTI